MKLHVFTAALSVLLLNELPAQVTSTTVSEATPPPKLSPAAVALLEEILEPALAGYNAGKAEVLFAHFASTAQPPPNERTFRAVFEGVYKKEFGKVLSKKLITKETEPDPNYGVLVYDATCEKRKVRLSVNFVREGGALKIAQIRMEKP